jgi:hypothetical protein
VAVAGICEKLAEAPARQVASKAKKKDGGWKRPEKCQGNKPEIAFSIPLTIIPLTLGFSHQMADRESCRICMMLTGCSARGNNITYYPSRGRLLTLSHLDF